MLARPDDAALREKVRSLLETLKADPENHIASILSPADVAIAGGNPQAAFYLALEGSTMAVPFLDASLPLRFPSTYKGMHGFLPGDPRMRSTFLIAGPGIATDHNLGMVDVRAIAPTLAKILGARLPSAELPPIDLRERPATQSRSR